MQKSLDCFKSSTELILLKLSSKNFDNQFTALHHIILFFLKVKGWVKNKALKSCQGLNLKMFIIDFFFLPFLIYFEDLFPYSSYQKHKLWINLIGYLK